MANDTIKPYQDYLKDIEKKLAMDDATEHTHRAALQALIESLLSGVSATNEPKHIKCGAPDFVIRKGSTTIGYIEAKDIGKSLDETEKTDQLKRYLNSLTNLILTDYLEFRWYMDGEKRLSARLGTPTKDGKIKREKDGIQAVADLITTFLDHQAEKVGTPHELAQRMARLAHMIRDLIIEAFKQEAESGSLHNQLAAFQENLIPDLSVEYFANETPYHDLATIQLSSAVPGSITLADPNYKKLGEVTAGGKTFVKVEKDGLVNYWKLEAAENVLKEAQSIVTRPGSPVLYNGAPKEEGLFYQVGNLSEIDGQPNTETGSVDPFSFIKVIKEGTVVRWGSQKLTDGDSQATVYYQVVTKGADVLVPGLKFKIDPAKGATTADRVNFISLLLSLFLGTAALPHILIRYYTVPSPAFARKSTIVAVAAIGLFYLLTLYMGLGAMTHGVLDLTNDNMSAPLLARSFGLGIFAIICAIAFSTILGTVSGLIVAASGAVANDLVHKFMKIQLSENKMVFVGRMTAIVVGIIAMALGIAFKHMNVSFLVGWAFTIAASANLPAIIMILFWKKTTAKGVIASISVGLIASLVMIILSPDTFVQVFNLPAASAPMPISQPAIISIPLSFVTLVVVSMLTRKGGVATQV